MCKTGSVSYTICTIQWNKGWPEQQRSCASQIGGWGLLARLTGKAVCLCQAVRYHRNSSTLYIKDGEHLQRQQWGEPSRGRWNLIGYSSGTESYAVLRLPPLSVWLLQEPVKVFWSFPTCQSTATICCVQWLLSPAPWLCHITGLILIEYWLTFVFRLFPGNTIGLVDSWPSNVGHAFFWWVTALSLSAARTFQAHPGARWQTPAVTMTGACRD